MEIFDTQHFDDLTTQAKSDSRLRQHRNIHQSCQYNCKHLFNAIKTGSYIRPHRHASEPREKLLIAIRGSVAFITFDDQGAVSGSLRFGTEKYSNDFSSGIEVASHTWQTVIALEPGCILLEVKAGPFDANQPKDLALWSPEECSDGADDYLKSLIKRVPE